MITRLVLLMLVGEYVYCPVYIPSAFEQLIVQVKAVRISLYDRTSRDVISLEDALLNVVNLPANFKELSVSLRKFLC